MKCIQENYATPYNNLADEYDGRILTAFSPNLTWIWIGYIGLVSPLSPEHVLRIDRNCWSFATIT